MSVVVVPRTLSKSDFKLARSCRAKLFFRENGYPDNRDDDPYLKLLAEGGYMVEALAKARYEAGIRLEYGRDAAAEAARTLEHLRADRVTLFEATLLSGRRQARADIVDKDGTTVRLLEVKSKSFDGAEHAELLASRGRGVFHVQKAPYRIAKDWREYLEDVTYQVLLLERMLPGHRIVPFLVLVDKSKRAGVDDVPSLFELVHREGRDGERRLHTARYVGTPEQLAHLDILTEVDVSAEVDDLRAEVEAAANDLEARLDAPLSEYVTSLERDHRCKKCEFRMPISEHSGFGECWGSLADASPHVLELFSVRTAKAPDRSPLVPWMVARGTASLLDVPLDGFVVDDPEKPGGTVIRQRRQIICTQRDEVYVGPDLRAKIERLHGPVHFIDFETSRLALPYHSGMRPYGLVAFQWSAHTVDMPGSAPRHAEWLNDRDVWPNLSFAQSLRTAIGDDGPVLTWSHYERTVLKQIVADLREFGYHASDVVDWVDDLFGERLVNMEEWARCDYYHPGMKGRTSIKVVLDALWRADARMREQFEQWTGLAADATADPYDALPPVEIHGVRQDVHEGTGAMRAYQEMMYGEHKHDPVARSRWAALLRQYCRLDTLSMVLIIEHWRRLVGLADH